EHILEPLQRPAHGGMVSAAGRNELPQGSELDVAVRGQRVRRLVGIAKVRVDVLVVVALRERAVLLEEAGAARVRAAGLAPAVAAPVAEGLDDLLQRR